MDTVQAAWKELAGKYSNDHSLIDRLWEELYKKYSTSHRHYHNLVHLHQLLQLSRQHENLLQNKDVVDFAIFYHDIIYNVLRKDNEKRSGAIAVKRLKKLGVPATTTEAVQLFIEATQTHQIPAGIAQKEDLALFLDFDMAILAAEWPLYEAYARQVRKEYRLYPDKLYNPGRRQFLANTLQAPHVFHTELFRQEKEAKAKANIERERQFYAPLR